MFASGIEVQFRAELDAMIEGTKVSGDDIISHYTSVSTLKKMIDSKRIRFSHVSYMNDPGDGMLFFNEVFKYISKILYKSEYQDEIVRIVGGLFMEGQEVEREADKIVSARKWKVKIDWFYSLFKAMSEYKEGLVSGGNALWQDAYAISFVHDDNDELVNHWNSYGCDGFGVKIDFKVSEILGGLRKYLTESLRERNEYDKALLKGVSAYRCVYPTPAQLKETVTSCIDLLMHIFSKEKIDSSKDASFSVHSIMIQILRMSLLLKDVSYKNEMECRIIIHHVPFDLKDMRYSVSGSLIRPYYEMGLDLKSIKRITFGPRTDFRSVSAFKHYVNNLQDRRKYEEGILSRANDCLNYSNSKMDKYLEMKEVPVIVRSRVQYVGREKN